MLTAGTQLGAYEILDLLGTGGMGEVYLASDSRLGRQVAIKVLRPELLAKDEAVRRFRREAIALSRLSHPGIATLFDIGNDGGTAFLVMEFIRGVPLTAMIKQGPTSEQESVSIIRQVAEALADAHAAGVVHRDLKPANIVKTPKGAIKLLDFGVAQFVASALDDLEVVVTQTSDPIGTLAYMSPEQLRGETPDPRMDIWAMGLVLYELVTGVRPFRNAKGLELARAIERDEPRQPSLLAPQLTVEVEQVILKCLEKDPADRWQTAAEVAATLGQAQSGWTMGATRTTRTPARRSELRAADVTSIVAMPSRVLAPEQQAFLADAIAHALTSRLSGVEGMETRLPPSSADVERAGGDAAKIATAYGVTACVISSITQEDAALTLNVQLAEPRTRRVLWSGEYQGAEGKYLALVRKAADELRNALRPATGTGTTLPGTATETFATNVELVFQRARFHLNSFGNRGLRPDFTAALAAFDQCLQIDPRRADAAAGIAEAYMAALLAGDSPAEVVPLVASAVERALSIDPRSSRAWAIKSEVEPGRTPESLQRKLEYALRGATFGPDDAYAHSRLAGPLTATSYELSVAASAQASRLDPLVLRTAIYQALALSILGRPTEGLLRAEYALRMEPDQPFALWARAMTLIMCGEYDEASAVLSRVRDVALSRGFQPAWVQFASDVVAFSRGATRGDAPSAAAAQLIRNARGEEPFLLWQNTTQCVAPLLVRHGLIDDALALLQFRAQSGILEALDVLLFNPDFAMVRRDPRFGEVVDAADRRFRAMLDTLESARGRGELPAYLEEPIQGLLNRLSQPIA